MQIVGSEDRGLLPKDCCIRHMSSTQDLIAHVNAMHAHAFAFKCNLHKKCQFSSRWKSKTELHMQRVHQNELGTLAGTVGRPPDMIEFNSENLEKLKKFLAGFRHFAGFRYFADREMTDAHIEAFCAGQDRCEFRHYEPSRRNSHNSCARVIVKSYCRECNPTERVGKSRPDLPKDNPIVTRMRLESRSKATLKATKT